MISIEALKEEAEQQGVGISLIFKEYLHLIILDYLFKKGLFSHLVFQGGTALRFVYGGIRYSEDLDFVLKKRHPLFFNNQLSKEIEPLTSYVEKFLPFVRSAQLKIQKRTKNFHRYHLILEVEFLKAKDRTNIEIVNVSSYANKVIILRYKDIPIMPAITVESPEEILSDKLLAFAAREYLKGRDLWDIYFIIDTLKIPIDENVTKILKKKISDYALSSEEFVSLFERRLNMLKKRGVYKLKEEMDRFLPSNYRELFQQKYSEICAKEFDLLSDLLQKLLSNKQKTSLRKAERK